MDTKMTGGCMCGSVRYETSGEPFAVNYCHCQSCRKHNGAAVVTLAGYRADQVQFYGNERKRYESSPGAYRAFCENCGTPLTWEGDGGDLGQIIELHISTFDVPERMVPTLHAFEPERLSKSYSEIEKLIEDCGPWPCYKAATLLPGRIS